jgi:hypothetical protein
MIRLHRRGKRRRRNLGQSGMIIGDELSLEADYAVVSSPASSAFLNIVFS